MNIPCENCGVERPRDIWWEKCDKCGFRVCPGCLFKHKGKYGGGSRKCSRCMWGMLRKEP